MGYFMGYERLDRWPSLTCSIRILNIWTVQRSLNYWYVSYDRNLYLARYGKPICGITLKRTLCISSSHNNLCNVSMYLSTFTNTSILFEPISNACRHTRFVLSRLCTICQESSLLGSFEKLGRRYCKKRGSAEPVCVSQVLELGWRPRLHNSDGIELLDIWRCVEKNYF